MDGIQIHLTTLPATLTLLLFLTTYTLFNIKHLLCWEVEWPMMCCVKWGSQSYLPSLWQCGISVILPAKTLQSRAPEWNMSRAHSSLITPPYLWNFLLEFNCQYSLEFSPMKMDQLGGIEKFYLWIRMPYTLDSARVLLCVNLTDLTLIRRAVNIESTKSLIRLMAYKKPSYR